MGNKQTKAVQDVLAERVRQKEVKGYSETNDDTYLNNQLLCAAKSYLDHVIARDWVYQKDNPDAYINEEVPDYFPFNDIFWKPKTPRQDLIRVVALIIAEIERLDRNE